MKQCPACNRSYVDDALLYCLEDGSPLMPASVGANAVANDPNATLVYTPARETNPPPANLYPPAPVGHAPATPVWSPATPVHDNRSAGKSNARPWIIAAIAAVIVLGAGIVVLLAVIGKNSASKASSTNRNNTETPTSNILKDDFSTQNWPTGDAAYGSFYQDGEYHMKGKPNLYLYLFPLNRGGYGSKDASVKVTARSVDGESPTSGYGLVMHGKVTPQRQLEGYAFLIYTGSPAKYQIARFDAGEMKPVVPWTDSPIIRVGTNSNQIEVRASGTQLSMYVNGQFLKSITDTANYTDGFAGLYTSETNEVAFDDMEINR